MRFNHSRAGVIEFGADALATLRSFAQHAPDATEAGGVLLGRYIRGSRDLVVDSVTTPQPSDVRTRFTFARNGEHQRLIDEAWESSGGTCAFLGDWHTHAEPDPRPSMVDTDNWRRLMRESIRDDEACFFVIVGQREIRCWEGDRGDGSITRLGAVLR